MYYRRKILFATLEVFGGTLSHTKLQKVLFLVTRKQQDKSFDFVPYKFGSFSFQANQDLTILTKKGLISSQTSGDASDWVLESRDNYFQTLKKEDQAAIKQTVKEVEGLSQKELVKYTYQKYPFFAINSQIAEELLTAEEMSKVKAQRKTTEELAFFTIGYEGISLEKYLNKLIINNVKLLCDVRKNALSMKYGFSKNQLKNACEGIGIKYVHIPELGIHSEKRTHLNTMNDYKKLFDEYEKTALVENKDQLHKLLDLTHEYQRIAITCFERVPCMCHRSRVANALKKLPAWNIKQRDL
ncbi:MAG: DUF488 domain-containing protein [Ekhidna sp.]|nr:DUF488 domain-containing protein [Ekhidna sp.]